MTTYDLLGVNMEDVHFLLVFYVMSRDIAIRTFINQLFPLFFFCLCDCDIWVSKMVFKQKISEEIRAFIRFASNCEGNWYFTGFAVPYYKKEKC